jgi:mannose-6-phosphate isomerase-like protein (cupin superfamily)
VIIRNFLEAPGKRQSVHEGVGQSWNVRVFDNADFDTALKFINYLEMEPGSTIGVHKHSANEEVYVVLAGSGVMTVNDDRRAVKTGDIIVNKPGWAHGLENTSEEILKLFVFEVEQERKLWASERNRLRN